MLMLVCKCTPVLAAESCRGCDSISPVVIQSDCAVSTSCDGRVTVGTSSQAYYAA